MANLNHDIEKYLRGELTPAEMHALEQKALLDPFLAEALEGAEQAAPEEFAADIRLIHDSLRKKAKVSRRFINIHGWQWYSGIAAGLALLALSTYTVLMMIDQQAKKSEIASAEEEIISDTLSGNLSATKDEADTKAFLGEAPKEKTEEKQAEQKPRSDQYLALKKDRDEIKNSSSTPSGQPNGVVIFRDSAVLNPKSEAIAEVAEGPVVKSSDPVVDSYKYEDYSEELSVKADDAEENTRSLARKKSMKAEASPSTANGFASISNEKLIRGKVTSNGEGLPGINILVKGTSIGTVTNGDGEYMISVPEGNEMLSYNYIGLQTEEVPVSDAQNGQLNVEMKEDLTQLSEVVVTGRGGENPDRTFATMMMAMPRGGRRAFKKYLEDNVRYPQQALDHDVKGRVIVQFVVDPSGKLTDFKVVRGIGFGCEEEVIRAIQNGPSWQPTKKDNTAVTEEVKVKYRFEKK